MAGKVERTGAQEVDQGRSPTCRESWLCPEPPLPKPTPPQSHHLSRDLPHTIQSDVFEKLRHPGSCSAHAPLKACQRQLSILVLFSLWTTACPPLPSGQWPPQQCRRRSEPVLSTAFKSHLLTAGGWGACVILCAACWSKALCQTLPHTPFSTCAVMSTVPQ